MRKSLLINASIVLLTAAIIVSSVATFARAEIAPDEMYAISDDTYLPLFPPAELCDESRYLDLADYLAAPPELNLSYPIGNGGQASYGYLFRNSTLEQYDTFSDNYNRKSVAFPNGTIKLTYDNDGRLLSFYMSLTSSGIIAAEEERNTTLLKIANELDVSTEGMHISHVSMPFYDVRNNDVVVLSDSIGDQPLAGCNILAAYFDRTSGRLVALEGRVFVPRVVPTLSVAEAEVIAKAEVSKVKLSPLHNVSETQCIGVRLQPILIPIPSYPIPGDDYNRTPGTERIYRFGYEFIFNITAQGVFEYRTMVIVDAQNSAALLHWRQLYPDLSGGNGELPDRVLDVRADTNGGLSLSWSYATWRLASGGIKEFQIFRNVTGEEMHLIAVLPCPTSFGEEATIITYNDTNITDGTSYYYQVQAISYLGYGSSAYTFGPFTADLASPGSPASNGLGTLTCIVILCATAIVCISLFVIVRNRRNR